MTNYDLGFRIIKPAIARAARSHFTAITSALSVISGAALLGFTPPAQAGPLDFNQKFLAPDGASDDYFGRSVSLDGNYALIGSYRDDDNGSASGSAYLFDVTTGNLLHKLLAPDGATAGYFGLSVSLDENYALIGSYGDDDNGDQSGSAYLFDVTTGNLLHKLLAPDGAIGDLFGLSVSLDGNYALISSHGDDDNGSASGSAYLFDVTTGNLVHKLLAPDGASVDNFGFSVSLDGNYALIGSHGDDDNGNTSGSAYLFDITTGNLLHKLLAPDGASLDYFGHSVLLDENYALIGSYRDDDNGNDSGSAYLFDVTTGNLLQKFLAPDGVSGDNFGGSLSLDGNYALIGSYGDDNDSGSAYLFDVTTGNLVQKLLAPDGASGDNFGGSVSLDGNYALIGSHQDDDNGDTSGSAYLFAVAETPEKTPDPSAVRGLIMVGALGVLKRFAGQHQTKR